MWQAFTLPWHSWLTGTFLKIINFKPLVLVCEFRFFHLNDYHFAFAWFLHSCCRLFCAVSGWWKLASMDSFSFCWQDGLLLTLFYIDWPLYGWVPGGWSSLGTSFCKELKRMLIWYKPFTILVWHLLILVSKKIICLFFCVKQCKLDRKSPFSEYKFQRSAKVYQPFHGGGSWPFWLFLRL